MPKKRITVDPTTLAEMITDIENAFDHQGRWGPSGRMAGAARRTQHRLRAILAEHGHESPR